MRFNVGAIPVLELTDLAHAFCWDKYVITGAIHGRDFPNRIGRDHELWERLRLKYVGDVG